MTTSSNEQTPEPAWIEMPDEQEFTLTGDCRIGRVEGNEIVNPDNRTSRRHAVIQPQGRRWILVDLGSTNGTFLNDSRIFKPTLLEDGDVVTVGTRRLVFHQPRSTESHGAGDEAMDERTMAAVGRTYCWMVLLRPGTSTDATWSDEVESALGGCEAKLKRLPEGELFAHWREGQIDSERIRSLVVELSRRAPSARLIVHYGGVRVGPSTTGGEENLLGADVSFTHQVGGATDDLGDLCVLSEPAVESLRLSTEVSALEIEDLPAVLRKYPLFKLN